MTREGKAILEQMYQQFSSNHNEDRALALYEALKEIETFSAMKALHPIEWIPVSEDLPDVDEDDVSDNVLVCGNFPIPTIAVYSDSDGGHWYGDYSKPLDKYGIHITAWMPLPTPYAGGRN